MATRSTLENNQADNLLFGEPEAQERLQYALEDMYYLLSRDYPLKASLTLAGNRYQLVKRQQQALQGMSCSANELSLRKNKEVSPTKLKGQTILLDGFNVLIILETALSGGFVFEGLDGCYRDISSVHGSYRTVQTTEDALIIIGKTLQQLQLQKVIWVFDAPVSNSGKLKGTCYEIAEKHHFPWEILLENAPDKYLIENSGLICSSDAWVLDECKTWFNLGAYLIKGLPETKILSFNKRLKQETLNKNKRIIDLVEHLQNKYGATNIVINDHWEGDLEAIGLTDKTGKYLVYISTFNLDYYHYFLSLENPPADNESPYSPAGDYDYITLEELESIVARHLKL
ncbi:MULTISPECIES: DUF434 domain-containing protein [Niastella]|uniref:DUF434 domain-containing protein n=1 Tax=Niastella soli TaxID=2821487 RepID=A0ABS3YY51_9BACT|nr:DUF434 domain-containing protein [Niastella soli]MBO9202437.1 DUF434 domain-containing protein [Niastella soli]